MKKTIFVLMTIVALSVSSYAQEKLSAYSRLVENNYKQSIAQDTCSSRMLKKLAPLSVDGEGAGKVEVLVELEENAELSAEMIADLGMKIENSTGNILIVNMPIESLSSIAEFDEVKTVSVSRRVKLLNDKARSATKVSEVHNGTELPRSYSGKDVVVGVVDLGIDFNHINFKDENSKSRVKVAGSYDSFSGTSKIYDTEAAIANITTDYRNESHGTHVSGIAAGSYKTNNYYGMATESDLVLYGLGSDMSDTNILKGVKTVFDYADSVNKPAVVNLSLGANVGPHDGSDAFNKALDELADEGKIIVVASGNEGSDKLHINETFTSSSTSTPQYSTIVSSYYSSTYECEVDTWSNGSEPIGIQFFIYNNTTKTEVLTSSVFYPTTTDNKSYRWSSSALTTYFRGTIQAIGQLNSSNNKYQMYAYIMGNTTSSKYYVGVKIYGKQNTEVNSWTSAAEFVSLNNDNYIEGSPNGSYSDMCCGKKAISIGAYCAKSRFTTINGGTYSYDGAKVGNIAYFSSYGTDLNGVNHPDVVAPGFVVVSSVNNYDNTTTVTNKSYLVNMVSPNDDTRSYHWGEMSGTSMAAPVATGTVALWLQANPNLTPEEVRTIMKTTATTDSYTQTGNKIQWGAGKLNAQAGLINILQNSAITDITLPDEVIMLSPNPSDGNISMYIPQKESEVRMSVYNTNGSLLYNEMLCCNDGIINAQLKDKLSAGIYIVVLQGVKSYYTMRIIIK